MNLSLLQDIHLSDENFWSDFLYYWNAQNYTRAINILQENQQLVTKYVSAEWLNALTAFVYQLETLPDNLNKKQIIVSYLPPDLETGGIWFQLQMGDILINVYTAYIPAGSTSVSINYSNTLINAVAYKNNEEVIVNQVINESGHTVTFSLNEAITNPVVCMVYTTNNANVVVNTVSASSGTNSFQVTYSGSLLSVMYLDNSNNRQFSDLTIGTTAVTYNLGSSSSTTTKGRVVYIPTNQLSNILKVSSKTFSSTTTTLLCDGYMVSCFLTDASDKVIQGDVGFDLTDAVINIPQNNNSSIKCVLYYT